MPATETVGAFHTSVKQHLTVCVCMEAYIMAMKTLIPLSKLQGHSADLRFMCTFSKSSTSARKKNVNEDQNGGKRCPSNQQCITTYHFLPQIFFYNNKASIDFDTMCRSTKRKVHGIDSSIKIKGKNSPGGKCPIYCVFTAG